MSRFTLGDPSFREPRSYPEWREMLLANRAARSTEAQPAFGGPLAAALRKRWDWLEDAERRGIPYRQASIALSAALERDADALDSLTRTAEATRVASMSERDPKASRRPPPRRAEPDDDPLFDYANERIR